jgi:hypothetical protein
VTENDTTEDSLTTPLARRFVDALRALEDRGEIDDMVALAADDTRWWSTGPDQNRAGDEGAARFWRAYREAFAEIRSEFTAATETPGRVVLEWRSTGRHHDGSPVRYSGVTVLDLGGTPDDPVLAEVRLYFDTAAARGPAHAADSMLDRETAASGRNSGLASSA